MHAYIHPDDWRICIEQLRRWGDTPSELSAHDGPVIAQTYRQLQKERMRRYTEYRLANGHQEGRPAYLPKRPWFNACQWLCNIANNPAILNYGQYTKLKDSLQRLRDTAPPRFTLPASGSFLPSQSDKTEQAICLAVLRIVRKQPEAVHDFDAILHLTRFIYRQHRGKKIYYQTEELFYTNDIMLAQLHNVLNDATANPYASPDPALFKGLVKKTAQVLEKANIQANHIPERPTYQPAPREQPTTWISRIRKLFH